MALSSENYLRTDHVSFAIITLTLILMNLSACQPGAREMDLSELVPESIGTWSNYEDSLYDKETIFEYMNGAGEVFLSFAYERMFVRRFSKSEDMEEELTVEIYDMGKPSDAFGIFTRFRSGDEAGIGQTSSYLSGNLNFWKDRYFVIVFVLMETEESKKDMFEFSRSIAEKIEEEGELPAVVSILPPDNLIEDSVKFFHLHTDLNRHYFVSDENIFNLDKSVDSVIAIYRQDGNYTYLLINKYLDVKSAQDSHDIFVDIYMPESKDSGIVQIEDGLWTATSRSEEFTVTVFDAATPESARQLLETAQSRIEGERR